MSDEEIIDIGINLILTIIIYMTVPLIEYFTKMHKFTEKSLKIFVIVNSIIAYIICSIISYGLKGELTALNMVPMLFYGYVNYYLLSKNLKKGKKEKKGKQQTKMSTLKEDTEKPNINNYEKINNIEALNNQNNTFKSIIIGIIIGFLILSIVIGGYLAYEKYIKMEEEMNYQKTKNDMLRQENDKLKNNIKDSNNTDSLYNQIIDGTYQKRDITMNN